MKKKQSYLIAVLLSLMTASATLAVSFPESKKNYKWLVTKGETVPYQAKSCFDHAHDLVYSEYWDFNGLGIDRTSDDPRVKLNKDTGLPDIRILDEAASEDKHQKLTKAQYTDVSVDLQIMDYYFKENWTDRYNGDSKIQQSYAFKINQGECSLQSIRVFEESHGQTTTHDLDYTKCKKISHDAVVKWENYDFADDDGSYVITRGTAENELLELGKICYKMLPYFWEVRPLEKDLPYLNKEIVLKNYREPGHCDRNPLEEIAQNATYLGAELAEGVVKGLLLDTLLHVGGVVGDVIEPLSP